MWGCPPPPLRTPPPLPPRNAPSCVAWRTQLCQPHGRRFRARLRSHVAPSRFPLAQPLGTATVPRTVSWHSLSIAYALLPPSCHCTEEVNTVQWANSLTTDGSAPNCYDPQAGDYQPAPASYGSVPGGCWGGACAVDLTFVCARLLVHACLCTRCLCMRPVCARASCTGVALTALRCATCFTYHSAPCLPMRPCPWQARAGPLTQALSAAPSRWGRPQRAC